MLFARLELFQCCESLFPCEFARITWLAVRSCFHGCTGWSLRCATLKFAALILLSKICSVWSIVHSYARFVGTQISFRRMRLYSATTATEWLARHITEAFPRDEATRYLMRDRGPARRVSRRSFRWCRQRERDGTALPVRASTPLLSDQIAAVALPDLLQCGRQVLARHFTCGGAAICRKLGVNRTDHGHGHKGHRARCPAAARRSGIRRHHQRWRTDLTPQPLRQVARSEAHRLNWTYGPW